MIASRLALAAAALCVAASFFMAPPVSAQTAETCLGGQLRMSGQACKGIARCWGKAMKLGAALSGTCIDKRQDRMVFFAEEIEELSPCFVEGDSRPIGYEIEEGVAELGNAITLAGGKCGARKMAALGKACNGFFRCSGTAEALSLPVDPECLSNYSARLATAFQKLETRGGCVTSGDAGALESTILDIENEIHGLWISGVTPTSTSSTSTSTSTTMP